MGTRTQAGVFRYFFEKRKPMTSLASKTMSKAIMGYLTYCQAAEGNILGMMESHTCRMGNCRGLIRIAFSGIPITKYDAVLNDARGLLILIKTWRIQDLSCRQGDRRK
jgi:hypothetical protein